MNRHIITTANFCDYCDRNLIHRNHITTNGIIPDIKCSYDFCDEKCRDKYIATYIKPVFPKFENNMADFQIVLEMKKFFEDKIEKEFKSCLIDLKKDLQRYFEIDNKKKLSPPVRKFNLELNKTFLNTYSVEIHPISPKFDEEYSETAERTKELFELGKKYDFANCGIASEYFGK